MEEKEMTEGSIKEAVNLIKGSIINPEIKDNLVKISREMKIPMEKLFALTAILAQEELYETLKPVLSIPKLLTLREMMEEEG